MTYALRAVLIRKWVLPGWHRREENGSLIHIEGWRLVLHRILWGFGRLKYIGHGDAWVECDWPVFS